MNAERMGFGPRLGAYLIDGLAIVVGGFISGTLLGGALGAGAGTVIGSAAQGTAEGAVGGGVVGGLFGAMAGAMLACAGLGAAWAIWEALTGQTLGKLFLGLRVGDAAGVRAEPNRLIARAAVKYSATLLTLVSLLTGIGLFSSLASLAGIAVFVGCFLVLGAGRQALHDMLAGTAVFRSGDLE